MKERNRYRILNRTVSLLWMAAVILLHSCIKEGPDSATSGMEDESRIIVRLNVGSQQSTITNSKEGIHEIRIICTEVADAEREIVREIIADKNLQNQAEYSFTLDSEGEQTWLKSGITLRFYVVCNETGLPSIAQSYIESYNTENQIIEYNKLTTYVVNESGTDFYSRNFPQPSDWIQGNGIPITGYKEVTLEKKKTEVDIPVYYMVAKIQLNVVNNTNEVIWGYDVGVNGSEYFADRAYLFPQTDHVVPDETIYDARMFGLSSKAYDDCIEIEEGSSINNLITLYFYPADRNEGKKKDTQDSKGAGEFQLSLWDGYYGKNYHSVIYNGTTIDRNTFIKVNAGLGNNDTEFGYEVVSWGNPIEITPPSYK